MATETLLATGFNDTVSDDFGLWAGSDRVTAIDGSVQSEATGIEVPNLTPSPTSSQMILANTSVLQAADTVNSVTFFVRALGLEGSNPCNFYLIARIWDGSNWQNTLSVKQSFTDTIASYSEALSNPLGGAWTKTDIDNCEYRIRLTNDRGLRVFWAYVDVDYTASGGGGPGPWIDDGCSDKSLTTRIIGGLTNAETYEFEITTKDFTGNQSTGIIVEDTPNPAEASPAPQHIKTSRGVYVPRGFNKGIQR